MLRAAALWRAAVAKDCEMKEHTGIEASRWILSVIVLALSFALALGYSVPASVAFAADQPTPNAIAADGATARVPGMGRF